MNSIHIALCCDEKYLPYATTTMLSCIDSSKAPEDFHFHLIGLEISARKLEKLSKFIAQAGSKIDLYTADLDAFSDFVSERFGPAACHRINLPEYLCSSIGRVIYLDSDILVTDDLRQLWSTPLDHHSTAAALNFSPSSGKMINLQRESYFNSGVLIIDLDQWREGMLHKKVSRYAHAHRSKLEYADQCSLNAVINDDWKRLPYRWNLQADAYVRIKRFKKDRYPDIQELTQALKNPGALHFTGDEKPWLMRCFHPYKRRYMATYRRTPFYTSPPPDFSTISLIRRLLSWEKHVKQLVRTLRFGVRPPSVDR